MHAEHWGLEESPFRSGIAPKYFFNSPTHDEALARLFFLVENHRRLGYLSAPFGSGKTMLLSVLNKRLRRVGCETTQFSLLGCDSNSFLLELAVALGLAPRLQATTRELWRAIADRMRENRYRQTSLVILLDDADQASPETLNQVTRLASIDPSVEAMVTIVLAADSDAPSVLTKRLCELIELRIDVERWNAEVVTDFLADSVSKAGGDREVFAPEAAERLHQLSAGLPRRVSQLAELALVAGAGRKSEQIDVKMVEAVHEELAMHLPTVSAAAG